jgi:hypothetical protein
MIVNENGLQISHEAKEGSIHWLAGRDFEQAEAKLTEALNQAEHINGFAFWVFGLIQFLWICGTLIDQEISIHGWASFLPAWLMFMHVEEVKALVITSLQRLVVQCQVPT